MIRIDGLPLTIATELRDQASDDAGWKKAAASDASGGDCLYVKPLSHGYTALRNSTQSSDVVLFLTAGEWAAFKNGVLAGEF